MGEKGEGGIYGENLGRTVWGVLKSSYEYLEEFIKKCSNIGVTLGEIVAETLKGEHFNKLQGEFLEESLKKINLGKSFQEFQKTFVEESLSKD